MWERRIPLTPDAIHELRERFDIAVQSSSQRCFDDLVFTALDVPVVASVEDRDVIMGVKEIPVEKVGERQTYVFFSHTVKGQSYNMPLLQRFIDAKSTLIDYERITEEDGRRLVAFGRHAGLAGAIDSLWTLGQAWAARGRYTPLAQAQPAHRYASLEDATQDLARVAAQCRQDVEFRALGPVVIGVTGGGRVSSGVHEVLDALDPVEVAPEALQEVERFEGRFVRVRFQESHFAERRDQGPFDLQDYYARPEAYRGVFEGRYIRALTLLINGIYWEPKYPRLVSKSGLRSLYGRVEPPSLVAIGDISCDIEGSVEATIRATTPDAPVYTWDTRKEIAVDGFAGPGPAMMTVDILPTELPMEASAAFSRALYPFMEALATHDFDAGVDALPGPLRRAVIVDRGVLRPDYEGLRAHLK